MRDKDKLKPFKYKELLLLCIIVISYVFVLLNFSVFLKGFDKFLHLLNPFIIGFVIAYLINPIIKALNKIFYKLLKKEIPNGILMILSYLIICIIIIFLFVMILPQIFDSFKVIANEVFNSVDKVSKWLESDESNSFTILFENKIVLKDILNKIIENLAPVISNLSNNFVAIFNTTSVIISFIFNWILGILISIYMLMHKKMYVGQVKKCIFAFFNVEKAKKILDFWNYVNDTFSRFLIARIVDSTIIGILCWLGCLILGFNNSILIAFIVGVTNVIPYFGPFIGAIPCALIVLLQSPMNMLIFLIFILILQQFDGNILGPKLLGDSLGLTSLWIIFSVTIMTSLFGIMGMVIGVPLFSIIYMSIKSFINNKLNEKELSIKTEDYWDKDYRNIKLRKNGNEEK